MQASRSKEMNSAQRRRPKNMVVVCGDRHWQYVSVDSKSGVRESSCGPASDEHAEAAPMNQILPEHRYLKVVGGFLVISVGQNNGETICSADTTGSMGSC